MVIEFGNEIPPRSFDRILPEKLRQQRIRIDPLLLPGMADSVRGLREQAAHWAAQIGGTRLSAVLAYCSAARLAALLVDALGDPGIPLILLDPVIPGPDSPQRLLHELALSMDDALGPKIPRLEGLPPDMALARASQFLRFVATRCAPDLDEDIADELTTGQRAWLSYTLSAATADQSWQVPGHVLLSAAMAWDADDARSVQQTGLSETELFLSPEVKSALTELLSHTTATHTPTERRLPCCPHS
ncbi:hypothetical protein [Streptomyces wuyuanensis]|uniref:hypothetical protein n=1 Tax=Streptomyces wuyuanensis TaxID=1196353 RepID=UPI0037146DFD